MTSPTLQYSVANASGVQTQTITPVRRVNTALNFARLFVLTVLFVTHLTPTNSRVADCRRALRLIL